jgi:Fe-S-cluster containining protein
VEISSREPVNKRHPELVLIHDTHRKLRREGDRCAALSGGNTPHETYACAIYDDRPRTCREFTRGGGNCLDARRRVGLSL